MFQGVPVVKMVYHVVDNRSVSMLIDHVACGSSLDHFQPSNVLLNVRPLYLKRKGERSDSVLRRKRNTNRKFIQRKATTHNVTKYSITQRLRTDLRRSVRAKTDMIHLFTGLFLQWLCKKVQTCENRKLSPLQRSGASFHPSRMMLWY